MSEAEVAWVAGILEGEGCWLKQKHGWSIFVGMTDSDVIEALGKTTGMGTMGKGGVPLKGYYKQAWYWQVGVKRDREELTRKVWPWLKERRREKILTLWPDMLL